MITNFKIFESIDLEIGNYLILKEQENRLLFLKDRWNMNPYLCVKIVEITKSGAYYVETFDKKTKKELIFWVEHQDIERRATESEIKDFEMKKLALKYNI